MPAVTPGIDLPPAWRDEVLAILGRCMPGAEVWAYGSRVTGQAQPASDLDLALRNPRGLDVELDGVAALRQAFIDSNLPIRVDILDWARAPGAFRAEIAARHAVLRPAP